MFELIKGLVRILLLFVPQQRFLVHRIFGFLYLAQWFASFGLYLSDYKTYIASILPWSMPLTGLIQSITAVYYFWFLPKKQEDPGYYSDKSTLSYNFVKENIFFAALLLFQCVYYWDFTYFWIQQLVIPEYFFVFLPYTARGFFPKTSFRDSLNNPNNKSDKNYTFYIIVTWITKIFYVWAKHYIGFYLNYVRFADRVHAGHQQEMYLLLIFSGFATTISMFLHTLKFKGLLNPRVSYIIYMASYLATFYSIFRLYDVFTDNLDLFLITLVGIVINFYSATAQNIYQVMVMLLLTGMRFGHLSSRLI